jgi:excisionase family DNA binding protein
MTRRCYTVGQLLEVLTLGRSTFYALLEQGRLPFLEELKPRIGGRPRYRADLVDRYLAGEWGQSRTFASHRRVS